MLGCCQVCSADAHCDIATCLVDICSRYKGYLQVDKLSKALTYALAELHRRGFNTLRFDWKELVFVDASASP